MDSKNIFNVEYIDTREEILNNPDFIADIFTPDFDYEEILKQKLFIFNDAFR